MTLLNIQGKKIPEKELDLSGVAKDEVALSESAAKRIAFLLEKAGNPNGYFRVGLKGGGCSGLTYNFGVEQAPKEQDKVFEMHHVKICVDPKSLGLMGGSTLDWYSSFMQKGFRLLSPKKQKSCSCGESFSF